MKKNIFKLMSKTWLTDLFDNKLDQDEHQLTQDPQQTSQTYRNVKVHKGSSSEKIPT